MKTTVVIDGTLVGYLSEIEVNQPWFSGLFKPLPSFDIYHDLFTQLRLAYRDERHKEADRLFSEVDHLDIRIVEPTGQISFSTKPNIGASQLITCVGFDLRFEMGIMSWRPL